MLIKYNTYYCEKSRRFMNIKNINLNISVLTEQILQ